MSIPTAFLNSPQGLSTYNQRVYDFQDPVQLGQLEWTGVGHTQPDGIDDIDGGRVTLGTGSANAQDYVQCQKFGSTVFLNRASKQFQFLWGAALSSATLTEGVLCMASTNTAMGSTNIADGFGFFCNLSGGPGTGYWYAFVSTGSVTQFTTYTQLRTLATDTNPHTFGIQFTSNSSTLGAGLMTWWIDGTQVANYGNAGGALFTQLGLRQGASMGNGSGVAQTMYLYEMSNLDMR